ncbi:MAG TPA: hypothetical protein VGV17_02995 [Bosea sp. (in: a-proteobacteria)]|jgi:hypothetical protein|uniref:hypothetical protein n=1 Tax=Bosea sp. (in: a-proteobacteria) TaxID=1871050 RepID=UPI002DDCA7EB|nr:hypothetical protein [Bosea sp. (in: a-proteobacteria)]HEV2552712.1 hypothetical protein [Bosea sp. (in: a-proteobacteria)]
MKKTILVASCLAVGLAAGVMLGGASRAADEVRCRVNVEALVSDLAKLNRPLDADGIKDLLKPKPARP